MRGLFESHRGFMKAGSLSVLVAAFVLITGSSAMADTGIQTESYSDTFSFQGTLIGSKDLFLPKFDNMNGLKALVAVAVTLDATQTVHVTAENKADNPGLMGVSKNGSVVCDWLGVGEPYKVAVVLNQLTEEVSVQANDGVDGSGPDFHDFGLIQVTSNGSKWYYSPESDLSAFVGTGDLTFLVDSLGGFMTTGITDATINVSNMSSVGTVTVDYFYEQVPEPATLALLGFGGVVALVRRRRK